MYILESPLCGVNNLEPVGNVECFGQTARSENKLALACAQDSNTCSWRHMYFWWRCMEHLEHPIEHPWTPYLKTSSFVHSSKRGQKFLVRTLIRSVIILVLLCTRKNLALLNCGAPAFLPSCLLPSLKFGWTWTLPAWYPYACFTVDVLIFLLSFRGIAWTCVAALALPNPS